MTQGKICPFCQEENAPYVERCKHCGRPFPALKNRFVTTDKVAKTDPELTGFLPSVEELDNLANNTLVLFVNGEEEPILLKDVQEIILGRPMMEMPSERTFDLTDYGAMTLGVSRRHIQITYANGTFSVLDLDSTNGTSLNGRFLPPGRSQILRPFDQLTLGQLRLMVYFAAKPGEQGKNFLLTDKRATQTWSLTPHYLGNVIIPYTQALVEIQNIIREVHGQSAEDIQVLYIQSGQRPAQVRLRLLMADEAIEVVRQWIGPWQRIYADPGLLDTEPNEKFLIPQIRDLVVTIANQLVISYSELQTFSLREKLFFPVQFIATSGLELTLESLD